MVGQRKVIGLTGGIASGKSTIAEYLQNLGIPVVNADRLGHLAYEKDSPGYVKVVECFGTQILQPDGSIDRRILGKRVFGNTRELKKLTDIVWPIIKSLAQESIDEIECDSNELVFLEAAVLIEAGWQDLVDEIWVSIVERETAIERTCNRDGLSREEAESRMAAQLSNEERIIASDVCIYNDGSIDELCGRVDEELERLSSTD